MRDPGEAVPDRLLVPVLDVAAEALRAMESPDVPLALRHLHGFDRRALIQGPGGRQLRRCLAEDEHFSEKVRERFSARPEVAALLERWSTDEAPALVDDAVARHDLALLASVLWACDPPGAAFGLGLVVAADRYERRDRGDEATARERAKQLAELEEARRRADAARMRAEEDAARAAQALREERRARRSREERAETEALTAQRQAETLQAQLDQTNATLAAERTRLARESQRARALEEELRAARAELQQALDRAASAPSRLDERDARVIADAVGTAQRLAAGLEAMRRRVEVSHPAPREVPAGRGDAAGRDLADRPLARRASPPLPAGLVAASPAGLEAMLRGDGVLLVIDGYNVTKRAWGEATASEQRERLGVAVTGLHRRLGCEVLCVFDGDGSGPRAPIRREGVRVLFSDAGDEADEVVVREVANLPKRVPVVVASSDQWVREHAEAEGAVVVPVDVLLGLLRPTR